jgi:hypothetical protein
MKCANCVNDAFFEYRITKKKSIFYCGQHLPRFLEPQRKAGHLTITPAMADAEESMFEKLTYQEFVVEKEIVVEEPNKPAPVKKAAKKSEKE